MKRLIFIATFLFSFPATTFAANSVYYSVGQNTSNHCGPAGDGNSCGNVSITSGVATFTAAQAGSNLGVGDVLTAGGNTYYLSAKNSTTSWNVVTNLGTTPSNLGSTAVTSIAHAFSSLAAAIPSGAGGAKTLLGNTDLTAIDVQLNIPCYYDTGADTAYVSVAGWTTDATRYIKVYTPNNVATEANTSQRHNGKWNDNKYKLEITANISSAIAITGAKYIHFDGIQVSHTPPDELYPRIFYANFNDANSNVRLSNSVMKANYSAITTGYYARTIFFYGTSGGDIRGRVWNNVLYYTGPANNGIGPYSLGVTAGTLYAYNNTIISYPSAPGRGLYCETAVTSGVLYAYNNVVKGFDSTNTYASSACSFTGDYNSTDSTDTTGQGSNSRISQTFSFFSEAGYDFRLTSTDAGARNYGTNLSADSNLSFSTDFEGDSRTTGKWDIGADEYTENGAFTLSAWVRPTGASAASKAIIAKAEEVRLATDGSGNPLCQIKNGGTWQTAAVSSSALAVNEWAHVACAYNRSTLKVYINGVQKDSDSLNVGVDNTTSSLKFGADDSSGTTYGDFLGFMDEVRMYPYARSAAQIRADYNAGFAGMSAQKGATLALGGGEPKWMSEGLVGYWRMDESSWNGTSGEVLDASGNGNNGTRVANATTSGGKFGKGGIFDGTDDRVSLGTSASLQPANITVAFWLKRTQSWNGTCGKSMFWAKSSSWSGNGWYIENNDRDVNSGLVMVVNGMNAFYIPEHPDTLFPLNEWTHIAATFNSATDQYAMYINGVAQTVSPFNSPQSISSTADTKYIGYKGDSSVYFDGQIDEVRIYNRAFGAEDVDNLFRWSPKPAAHVKMDEKVSGDAQTLYDTSGNQRNATTEQGANASGMSCVERGKFGSSCNLDGADDYLQISDFDY